MIPFLKKRPLEKARSSFLRQTKQEHSALYLINIENTLRIFFLFLKESGLKYDKDTLVIFKKHLQANDYAPNTITKMCTHTYTFLKYAYNESFTALLPRRPKTSWRPPNRNWLSSISLADMHHFVNYASRELSTKILWATGIRISELASLTGYNISEDGKFLQIKGKNGKLYAPMVLFGLHDTLKSLRETFQEEKLFPHMATETIRKQVVDDAFRFFRKKINPHAVRSLLLNRISESSTDPYAATRQAGHANLKTTEFHYFHQNHPAAMLKAREEFELAVLKAKEKNELEINGVL